MRVDHPRPHIQTATHRSRIRSRKRKRSSQPAPLSFVAGSMRFFPSFFSMLLASIVVRMCRITHQHFFLSILLYSLFFHSSKVFRWREHSWIDSDQSRIRTARCTTRRGSHHRWSCWLPPVSKEPMLKVLTGLPESLNRSVPFRPHQPLVDFARQNAKGIQHAAVAVLQMLKAHTWLVAFCSQV